MNKEMKVRMNEWKYTSMNLRVKVNVWMNEWETHSVKDPLSEIWKKKQIYVELSLFTIE